MPWSKAYDETEVLDRAMRAFWGRGYHATSMADLVAAMEINRGSIYAAFGDKRGLFLRALEHYGRTRHAASLAEDDAGEDPITALLAPLARAAAPVRWHPTGCLIVLTSQELAPHDAEIAGVVTGHFTLLEEHFRARLKIARQRGLVPKSCTPRSTARALVTLWSGLQVMARAGAPPETMAAILQSTRKLLT